MKTININAELNIDVINNYKEILNPDFIFIPIKDSSKIIVNLKDRVLKGQIIYLDEEEKKYSSVSGNFFKVLNIKDMSFMVIKNDYLEESINKRARNLDNLSKDDFMEIYSNNYFKDILNKNINTLYINAIDDDPYIYNKYYYLKNNLKDIEAIIKYISTTFKIKKVRVVIKSSYEELTKNYASSLTYHKMPNIYPIGNTTLLTKQLIKKDNDYLIDLNDLIDMIYEVKKNKVQTEKYISIGGNNLKESYVLNVKKYSYLNNLLTSFDILDDKYNIILNNSLCGEVINPKEVVISSLTDGFIINKISKEEESECSKCALCQSVCPLNLNPLKKDDRCIKCGLCNFVCPSKINIVSRWQK